MHAAAAALRLEAGPARLTLKLPFQVHRDHGVPPASLMRWNITSRRMPALLTTMSMRAEGSDRAFHHLVRLVPVGDVAAVGDGAAAGGADGGHHLVARLFAAGLAIEAAGTQVVHHHRGAGLRQRDAMPRPTPRPPPVTSATWPSRSFVIVLPLNRRA